MGLSFEVLSSTLSPKCVSAFVADTVVSEVPALHITHSVLGKPPCHGLFITSSVPRTQEPPERWAGLPVPCLQSTAVWPSHCRLPGRRQVAEFSRVSLGGLCSDVRPSASHVQVHRPSHPCPFLYSASCLTRCQSGHVTGPQEACSVAFYLAVPVLGSFKLLPSVSCWWLGAAVGDGLVVKGRSF